MALTAEQLYNQSSALQRGRVNQMYGRNLEMLARQMRDASQNLEASLESRGVLRSGEANTARERLKESEAAQRRYYTEDKTYDLARMDLEEQARKASGSGGSSGSMMPATGGKTPYDYLRDVGFNLDAYNGSRNPVGERLTLIRRPAGSVATKRYSL